MRKKKEVLKETWYIYTNHSHTNSVIAARLVDNNCEKGIKCSDGEIRDFWVCTREFLLELFEEKGNQTLVFNVFKKIGDGFVLPYNFAADYKSFKLKSMVNVY